MPEHAIVMHPGPMNRGMEITAEVADSPRCTAVEQVRAGVSVRMAVLYLLLGGAAAGALLMYMLDPDRGSARRATSTTALRNAGSRTGSALGNA